MGTKSPDCKSSPGLHLLSVFSYYIILYSELVQIVLNEVLACHVCRLLQSHNVQD